MRRKSFCARYSQAMAEIYAEDLAARVYYGYKPNPIVAIIKAAIRAVRS